MYISELGNICTWSVSDLYVEKMRYAAVRCMSRSYRPTVPVSYVAQVLGFTSVMLTTEGSDEESDGVEECIEWLKAHGACLTPDNSGEMQLDTKVGFAFPLMLQVQDVLLAISLKDLV